MITKTIFSSLLFIAFFLLSPTIVPAQQTAYKDMATDILKLVNAHRAGKALKPLKMNGMVTAAAEKHTRDMATKKIPFGHDGFNERMSNLSKQLKPTYAFAENVAYGAETAKDVVDQWLHSPEHKKNIEGPDYNLTGIGIQKGPGGQLFYTQIFIYKNTQ